MSLPAPYSEVYEAGTGAQVEFPFGNNFKPISAGLVKCKVYFSDGYETVPTYTVDMTVGSITISALTAPDGTILTAPPIGSTVRIYRDEPEAQNVTASQLQAYTAKQLEIALDAIVAMIQEVSYTADHKTVRLTEPQRDIALQELSELADNHLIYWDFTNRKLVVTNYPQQDVVRCVNGLFFRLRTDPDIQQPYLQWSTDNSDWHSIDVDTVRVLAQSAYDLANDAYNLASTTRGELNAHKGNHNNPHQTSMANLTDTDLAGAESRQFLQFDGVKWKAVYSTATVSWGGILGNLDDQTDLQDKFYTKFDKTGGTVLGQIDIRRNSSTSSALLTMTNNTANTDRIWRFAPSYSTVSLSVFPGATETNGYRFASTGFVPASNNVRYLGSASLKWKGVYTSALNNGADLVVPNKAGTLATMDDVELAARSGRMLTDQGVWYAKMYSATVVPTGAQYDGTNYADFSQVDGQGNPIIVIYNRVNGAWVQDQTIIPPAEYDGYVPITSKIWDIAEQTGQQGGRILWNHQSKEFTPYPQIISFKDIEITGNSTVVMPQAPSSNQIVNKDYVDNAIGNGTITITQSGIAKGSFTTNQSTDTTIDIEVGGTGRNVGDVFFTMRSDNELNGAVECDGATYNTTDFTGAKSIGQLLEDEKVPYLSLADYATALATNGSVGVFGWNGVGTTAFRVPALNDIFIETGTAAQIGDYITPGLPNITGRFWNGGREAGADGAFYTSDAQTSQNRDYSGNQGAKTFNFSASRSSAIYGKSATVQPNAVRYRAMVQLAVSATDEALETCTNVLAMMANADFVIERQDPTAANNYTWYRKYKSGWVEQGGISATGSGTSGTITLPIAMQDNNYTAIAGNGNNAANNYFTISRSEATTTTIKWYKSSSGMYGYWEVKGMAA